MPNDVNARFQSTIDETSSSGGEPRRSSVFSKVFRRFPSWGSSPPPTDDDQQTSNLASPPQELQDVEVEADHLFGSPSSDSSPRPPPEPTFLARRIQSLLGSFLNSSSSTATSTAQTPLPETPFSLHSPLPLYSPPPPQLQSPPPPMPASFYTPVYSHTGLPSPPTVVSYPFSPDATPTQAPFTLPVASPMQDPQLIAMLSSPLVMNGGSLPSGNPAEGQMDSVWDALDGMASPLARHVALPNDGGPADVNMETSVFSDGSSVMIYSPLVPTPSSLVELAESEIVVDVDEVPSEPTLVVASPPPTNGVAASGWMGSMWPFSGWGSGGSRDEQSVTPKPAVSQPRIIRQRVWIPSRTQISVQAMWWGYRLYLPPPVLDVLNDQQLETTRRAAIITSALTWFFGNFPVSVLPFPLQPAALLLQAIIPYLGHIGTFLSWGWGGVKSYDAGYGVVLTSTWLLPVALIPSTWQEGDFPLASPRSPAPTALMSPRLGEHHNIVPQTPRSPTMSVRFQPMALPLPTQDGSPTPRAPGSLSLPAQYPSSPPPAYTQIYTSPPVLQSSGFFSPMQPSSPSLHSVWGSQSIMTPFGAAASSIMMTPSNPFGSPLPPLSPQHTLYLPGAWTPQSSSGESELFQSAPSSPWASPPPVQKRSTVPLPELDCENWMERRNLTAGDDLAAHLASINIPADLDVESSRTPVSQLSPVVNAAHSPAVSPSLVIVPPSSSSSSTSRAATKTTSLRRRESAKAKEKGKAREHTRAERVPGTTSRVGLNSTEVGNDERSHERIPEAGLEGETKMKDRASWRSPSVTSSSMSVRASPISSTHRRLSSSGR